MAQQRPRDRVDQLREEAGVPPSPGSVEVRHRTMMDMQMVSDIPPVTCPSIFEILSSHEGELGDVAPGVHFFSGLSKKSWSLCEQEHN